MRRLHNAIRVMTAATCLAFLTEAHAAKITLHGGEVIEGQVIERTQTSVTIKTMSKMLTLPMSRVESIDEGGPGAAQLYEASEALRRGDLDAARSHCAAAIREGAPDEEVKPLLLEIDRRRSAAELQRYSELLAEARAASARGEEDPEAMGKLRALLDTMDQDNPARQEIISIICDYHLANAARLRDRVQNNRAEEELRAVIALDPTRANAYLDLADLYRSSSATWSQAIDNYVKALEHGKSSFDDRTRARIYYDMAEIYRQRNEWNLAQQNYAAALDASGSKEGRVVDRYHDCALRYIRTIEYRQPEAALRLLDDCLAIRRNSDMLETKGLILQRMGLIADSDKAFEELLALEPRRRDLHYHIAQNRFREGEILQGRELLTKEVDLHPRNYDALVQLGEYALQRDDYDAAQSFFLQARAIDPDLPRAALGLGRALRMQEKLPEAREAVQAVLARLPEDREANLEMGRIYLAENELEQAKEFFSEVLSLIDKASFEEREELKQLRADALIARGEINLLTAGPGTANMDFNQALEVLPDYGQAFYSIGRAYRRKFTSSKNANDLKEAETNLLKARDLQPENPQFALELGILYGEELAQIEAEKEQEYTRKAIENWRAYIELGGANAAQVRSWIEQKGV